MVISTPMLPLSYRAELLKPLLTDVRSGECCSLIGMGGTGKSNLGHFLERHDVQHTYWKNDLSWVILVDSHSLVFSEEKPEYAITELLIQHLLSEAEIRNLATEFLEWANAHYKHLTENPSAALAFRCLQNLCRRLCEQHGIQLILVFDQFEDLWKTLDAHYFLNLRSLRDQFKYQVVYLVMTRDRLQYLRQDAQAVESFWELFSTHTYSLGPYSEDDASVMIERLALRAGIAKTDVPHEVAMLSGRHPGLLRAIFWAFRKLSLPSLSVDNLLQIPSVCEECAKIWNTFSQDEQHITQLIVQDSSLPTSALDVLNTLRFKKIISGDPPALFSPLFTAYVLQKIGSKLPGVIIDVRLRQVWLDGQLLQQSLTPLEFRLLEYLARHPGTICKRESLVQALYDESYYDRSDQRLYAILSRLREALGESSQAPRYLITHRGGGVQLTQGAIINDETV